ncbi:MAG: hypothetical protein A2275_06950 [Bacteroidetes bacterium RIFOXYA12_FULL_35_11]|nr:MAG: hypothetical protein A2X01_01265 [Bacteroidetes bacterium GWF2_35_48]OFY83172.1 MAG: hypothetical protein A2275_06950 [Bacteroidetes bacterium RIFOXYA12_FULL_35_11]OFY97348.1 MAG: hypothetical protein A2491_21185 [Bacteroidetes bacterium RIFOXYC12_FULL_35_7]HBX51206.1 hypothetical protein [Bacteroidales bacterium]
MNPYKAFNTCILRTPLFSLEKYQEFLNLFNSIDNNVSSFIDDLVIMEALFLASPEFYQELLKLNKESLQVKDRNKIIFSLYKYLSRASTRCTPFGLFAGFSSGLLSDQTSIIENTGVVNYKRHTRLDMNYLCALASNLSKDEKLKNKLTYHTNNSLYFDGLRFRMVEYRYRNAKREHYIVSFDDTPYFRAIIDKAKVGVCFTECVAELITDDISEEEATEYVYTLIESQVLVSELEPTVTGPDFFDRVLNLINNFEELDDIKNNLKELQFKLSEINKQVLGIPVSRYNEITNFLSEKETKFEKKFLFQCDLLNAAQDFTINKSIAQNILEALTFLNAFTKTYKTNLQNFKEAFFARYETMEIPLLQALDVESGIGYAQSAGQDKGDISPLVAKLHVFGKQTGETEIKWTAFQNLLYKKFLLAFQNKEHVITLCDEDIQEMKPEWSDLPPTIYSMVEVYCKENKENEIYLNSLGGSSAGNLIGRFAHADDKTFDLLKEIADFEAEYYKDKIVAEIVHLPETRTGNVLYRPVVREYEIPYLAQSCVPKNKQIQIDDLYISVRNNKIVLRSKLFNSEIIPRLTNAHNYSFNALPAYQFLCDMQAQDLRTGFYFNWGFLSNQYGFLPRVVYKNIILSKATWNIQVSELKSIIDEKTEEKKFEAWLNWRKIMNIPKLVSLVDGDNELTIDTEHKISVFTLLSLIKKRMSFKLEEFLFSRENSPVQGLEGTYTNQFIFTFYKS